jgi:hypothetical protein
MKQALRYLPFLILAAAVGCHDPNKPVYANVKGTVTYNNKPVEKGEITFAIEGRPPSTLDIIDGKFNGQAMIGSNKVTVSAKKKAAAPPKLDAHADAQIKGYMKFKAGPGQFGGPPADYDPSMVEYIPAEWNTHSKQMRVIEAGGANDLEFDIKGKN